MKVYKHLFFDLDHTLWDFDRNAEETILELLEKYDLAEFGVTNGEAFIRHYQEKNEKLWTLYRAGKVKKEYLRVQRFRSTFKAYGIEDQELIHEFAEDYIRICPTKSHLIPNAIEILDYLHERYRLHLITNGFEEVQYKKLKHSNIRHYFREIITSEKAHCKKPDQRIFDYALRQTSAGKREGLMIGDNFEVDILGAQNAGIDQVYYHPEHNGQQNSATYTISGLDELKGIL